MRLHNLQALRGVACLLVLLFHLAQLEVAAAAGPVWIPRPALTAFCHCGFAGVDLFFVLSGFVITWVSYAHLGDRRRLVGYLVRRLWRIFPIYWACYAGCYAFLVACNSPGIPSGVQVVRGLLLWPPESLNLPVSQAWSLTFELIFYVAFAGFFLVPRRAFGPILGMWFAATVVATAIGGIVPADVPQGSMIWARNWFLHPLILEFLGGCIAAAIVRGGWRGCGRTSLMLGIAGFAAGGMAQYREWFVPAGAALRVVQFGLPSVLIVYGAVAIEKAHGWTLPRWLQKVGDASYSIYLSHMVALAFAVPFLTVFNWRHHDRWNHMGWCAAVVFIAIAVGFAVHYAVEVPLIRLGQRKNKENALVEVKFRRAA